MILAGDIGGTNARLALFEKRQGQLNLHASAVYPSRSAPQFADIVTQFLDEHPAPITHGCIGIAGPVENGHCRATNLPWNLDANALRQQFGCDSFTLLNDLEANAYGIGELAPGDLLTINPGKPAAVGNCAVIAAGTGLGEAGMFWDGSRHIPFATEGGHCDFGPRTALQVELNHYLQQRLGHVSYETILSGEGLEYTYDFLISREAADSEPAWLQQRCQEKGKAAAISATAMAGEFGPCSAALDLFIEIFGQEAGNLALKTMAKGGVYLGGGIAAKLAPVLQHSDLFMRGFRNKDKMQHLMETIPVKLILNEDTALLGAAAVGGSKES